MADGDKIIFGNWKVTTSSGDTRLIGWSGEAQTLMYDAYKNVTLQVANVPGSRFEWREVHFAWDVYYICDNFGFNYISYNDAKTFCANNSNIQINGQTFKMTLVPANHLFNMTYNLAVKNWDGSGYHFIDGVYGLTSELNSANRAIALQSKIFTYSNGVIDITYSPNYKKEFDVNYKGEDLYFIPILEKQNAAPVISGTDTYLGNKTEPFTVSYSVTDADNSSDIYVVESLNGVTIRKITNPTQGQMLTCTITETLLATVSVGSMATIQIEVGDGTSTVYRRYTFTKANSVPVINYSGEIDLGSISQMPTINYSVSDPQGEEITVVEKLNGTQIRTYKVAGTNNTTQTFAMTEYLWLTCGSTTNAIEIYATDTQGGQAYKSIIFVRQVNKVQIVTANAIQTDIAASKILLSPQWTTENCTCKAEACNNGFDDNPTWEDVTSMVNEARPYSFTNTTKTASKWGIKVRLTVTKNAGYTGEAAIYGFGGAYE